jgi:hypothetical protein
MITDQPGTQEDPTWIADRRREIDHFLHSGWTSSALWLRALLLLLLLCAAIAVGGEALHQLHAL